MKNQYVGDINDYRKYGILRLLSQADEIRLGVCWMLTAPDGRGDGRAVNYLKHPGKWRPFDPDLFDTLQKIVTCTRREIQEIEGSRILARALFYPRVLRDAHDERSQYFKELNDKLKGCSLLFFDPDNGFEVQSVPKGKKNSCKYVYWDEIAAAYRHHSLLVYQHFPRENRKRFIKQLVGKIGVHTQAGSVFSFRTARFVSFLIPHHRHEAYFEQRAGIISRTWHGQVAVDRHILSTAI